MLYDAQGPVILVGGAGVVGRRLALLLAQKEKRPLVIAGRTASRAAAVVQDVKAAGGEARFEPFDISAPPNNLKASALVGLVNDPEDAILQQAIAHGIPLVDITRWTTRVAAAAGQLALARPSSPVVLASGWMAGLLSRVAAYLAATLPGALDSIEGSIRYALADASGADSVDYMDRLWIPFEVVHQGRPMTAAPWSDPRRLSVARQITTVHRFDTPDQWSLPLTLGARSAAVRLGFDSRLATGGLGLLVKLGFFRWFAADHFRGFRHALLRSPGAEKRAGVPAAFRVEVTDREGNRSSLSLVKEDGQASLTAVGAWLALRFALTDPTFPGLRFPEQDPENQQLPTHLEHAGVKLLGPAS